MPDDINKQLENASGALDDATKAANQAVEAQKKLAGALGETADVIKKFETGISGLGSKLDNLFKKLDGTSDSMGDVADSSEDAQKGLSGVGKSSDKLSGSMDKSGKATGDLSDSLVKVGKAAGKLEDNLVKSGKTLDSNAKKMKGVADEAKKTNGILDIFKSNVKSGEKEAKEFAGGLGEASGGLVAVGVAATYAAGKISEVLESVQNAAIGFAKFRVSADVLANTTLNLTASGLIKVREELGVTSKTFSQFSAIIKDGASTGVAGIEKLTEAGIKLREAYGGDQLDNLREFVDLLKEIPSLDPEIKVNASFDQDSSNLLALAANGQIEAFIKMESAGLFGGVATEESGTEGEILDAQLRTAKTVDDVLKLHIEGISIMGTNVHSIRTGNFSGSKFIGNWICCCCCI